jgi:integrase
VGIETVDAAIVEMLPDLDLASSTRRVYKTALKAFLRYLSSTIEGGGPCPLSALNEDTLVGYARWLRENYPDPRALPGEEASGSRGTRVYMTCARRLLSWLDIHYLLPSGVSFDRISRRALLAMGNRRQAYPQKRPDPDIMRILARLLETPLPTNQIKKLLLLRNRALVALLYDTGARISEALALTREDVMDGRAEKIYLTRTKNGKPRAVFLSEDTRAMIVEYVRARGPKCSYDDIHAPLFISHGRQKQGSAGRLTPLGQGSAWYIVKTIAIAEGLYDNTSPHAFRHRKAQDLFDAGMPIDWISALLGHQSPTTTRTIYAWETDEKRLGEMITKYGEKPTEKAARSSRAR